MFAGSMSIATTRLPLSKAIVSISGTIGGTISSRQMPDKLVAGPIPGFDHALDAKLVVDAENDRPAACICERDDSLRDPFAIRKLYLQLEISVFAAADQAQQFGRVS